VGEGADFSALRHSLQLILGHAENFGRFKQRVKTLHHDGGSPRQQNILAHRGSKVPHAFSVSARAFRYRPRWEILYCIPEAGGQPRIAGPPPISVWISWDQTRRR